MKKCALLKKQSNREIQVSPATHLFQYCSQSRLPRQPSSLRRIRRVLAPPAVVAKRLKVTPLICAAPGPRNDMVNGRAGSSAHPAKRFLMQHLRSNPKPVAFVPFETSASCPRLGLVYVAVRISSQRRTAPMRAGSQRSTSRHSHHSSRCTTNPDARIITPGPRACRCHATKTRAKWRPTLSQRHSRGRPRKSNLSRVRHFKHKIIRISVISNIGDPSTRRSLLSWLSGRSLLSRLSRRPLLSL